MIGINPWLMPQISDHCPNKMLILLIIKILLLIWLGIASILKFIDRIIQEWRKLESKLDSKKKYYAITLCCQMRPI